MNKISIVSIFLVCSSIQLLSSDSNLDKEIRTIRARAKRDIEALTKVTQRQAKHAREEQLQAAKAAQEKKEYFDAILKRHPNDPCRQYSEIATTPCCCLAGSTLALAAVCGLPEEYKDMNTPQERCTPPGIYNIRLCMGTERTLALSAACAVGLSINQVVQVPSTMYDFYTHKQTKAAQKLQAMK